MRPAIPSPVLIIIVLLAPAAATVLISGTRPICNAGICKTVVTIPHHSVSGAATVDLHVWHASWHHFATLRRTKPLALLMAGAVIQPSDYDQLATHLARRGFAVAIPAYTQHPSLSLSPRDKEANDAARNAGLPCPPGGNFVTVTVITSVSDFLSARAPGITQSDTLLLGHSSGAVVASLAALGGCASGVSALARGNALCEGMVALPARMGVRVLVLFEGAFVVPVVIPPDMLVVHVYSPFFEFLSRNGVVSKAEQVRESVTAGRERFMDVGLKFGANHFLPVDFQADTKHARTQCKPDRPPPEDAFFSTRERQTAVVETCALVAEVAYLTFSGGMGLVRHMLIVLQRLPMVAQVHLLQAKY